MAKKKASAPKARLTARTRAGALRQLERELHRDRRERRRRAPKRPRPTGELWLPLSVQSLATDRELRSVVRRLLFSDHFDWPKKGRRRGFGEGRTRDWRERHQSVTATIVIADYLTARVPVKMRERTCAIRSEGEALVLAADMYLRVYRENERLGGSKALDPDVRARLGRRRRRAKRAGHTGPLLVNRGFEPLVWGHDLGDLVFEQIHIRWLDRKKTRAAVTFGMGS